MVFENITMNGTQAINSDPLTPFKDRFGCTLKTCAVSISLYDYRPSVAVNLLFIILFSTTGIIHITQLLFWPKRFFSCAVGIGCLIEVIGYVSRILGNHNPFGLGTYFVQFIGLTIAPAFFSASIYTTLGEITRSLGPQFSRLRPEIYTKVFISSDVASLILQGSGGLATLGLLLSGKDSKSQLGINVMLVGLGYQILSLMAFIYLGAEFSWRLSKYNKQCGKTVFNTGPGDGHMKIFVVFFCLSVFCLFVRCCYRCAELSGGLQGDLLHDEVTFIFLEGVLITISVFSLNLGHPGMLPLPSITSPDLDDEKNDMEKNDTEKQVPTVRVVPPPEYTKHYPNRHAHNNSLEDLIYKKPPLPPKPAKRRSGLQTLLSPTPASHFRRYASPQGQRSKRLSGNWPLVESDRPNSLNDIYNMYDDKEGGGSEWVNSSNITVDKPSTRQYQGKNGETVQVIHIRDNISLPNGLTISLGYPNASPTKGYPSMPKNDHPPMPKNHYPMDPTNFV